MQPATPSSKFPPQSADMLPKPRRFAMALTRGDGNAEGLVLPFRPEGSQKRPACVDVDRRHCPRIGPPSAGAACSRQSRSRIMTMPKGRSSAFPLLNVEGHNDRTAAMIAEATERKA